MKILFLHPEATIEHLGYLPGMLDADDPRPAAEQFNERYGFGGWRPQRGFTLDHDIFALKYPGDPMMLPIAMTHLRDELIVFYPRAYVAIVQRGGGFEVCRMD